MSEKINLEVCIADQNFHLSTTQEQKEQLEYAVALFNERFNKMRRENPSLDRSRASLMLGLEFAQEILELNTTLQSYGQLEKQLGQLVNDLDKRHPSKD